MKKPKPIFILVFCSLIPLLFTATIPYAIPTELHMNSRINNEHGSAGGFNMYVITLEEGSQYTIDVDTDSFWGMHIAIRIAETPYMINGFSVDTGSSSGETMHFTALKTGDYYIQLKIQATGPNVEFFDFLYLLVLILPSVSIVALGLLIMKRQASYPERIRTRNTTNIYKKSKKEEKAVLVNKEENDILAKKEDVMICEYCGSEINKYLKKCPSCHTSLQ